MLKKILSHRYSKYQNDLFMDIHCIINIIDNKCTMVIAKILTKICLKMIIIIILLTLEYYRHI